jgi:triosephosphate isomerase
MRPIIILNFKSYPQAVGTSGLELARTAMEVAGSHGVELYVAPHVVDTSMYCFNGIPVFAQHCDPVEGNGGTGRVTVDGLAKLNAKGILINHSEYPQEIKEILFLVGAARKYGLKTCICIPNDSFLSRLRGAEPTFLAVEPPELIGGDVSVSSAKPQLLSSVFRYLSANMPSTRGICGAGIKKSDDVRKAKALGADGVLVASGYVLANNPRRFLEELITGFD